MFSRRLPVLVILITFLLPIFALASCSAPASEIVLRTSIPVFSGNIYIGGAVNNPGIYPFSSSESLVDLVQAAGGLKTGASFSDVSLNIADPTTSGLPQRIDINTAETWLLSALPGIGPAHAADIVAYREANGPFRRVEDLLKVTGIGPATLDKIEDYISVG